MEIRDIRGRAEQGVNLWDPGEIKPVERQEKMERQGMTEKSDSHKILLEIQMKGQERQEGIERGSLIFQITQNLIMGA